MNTEKIPQELRNRDQWVIWDTANRNGQPTKLPKQSDGSMAKSNDPSTWCAFPDALAAAETLGAEGIGYVFTDDDPFCGVDLDGCRDPETGEIDQWARDVISDFATYAEVSPSKTGVKLFSQCSSPFERGRKVNVNEIPICDKLPAVEVYDQLRFFAVTGERLSGFPTITDGELPILRLKSRYFKEKTHTTKGAQRRAHTSRIFDRAEKYIEKIPGAVSGQGGHNQTFYAACVLVNGFCLSEGEAMAILEQFNARCEPAWSERELRHKINSALKQPGEKGYLRDVDPIDWDKVDVSQYVAQKNSAQSYSESTAILTDLEDATRDFHKRLQTGHFKTIDTGIPDLDYAIGGGIEESEMMLIAARPSHGKSALAMQMIHNASMPNDIRDGMPCLFVSGEMSARTLGKRALHWISDLHEEKWITQAADVDRQMTAHFKQRKKVLIAEGCSCAEHAADVIREAVAEHKVKMVAIDYAQMIESRSGSSQYEKISNASKIFREVANETHVILVALAQMSRKVEERTKFEPTLADIKGSGQLEQDADVVCFLFYPFVYDKERDRSEYIIFVEKNRNRPINERVIKCRFESTRQMLLHKKQFKTVESQQEFEEESF